MLLYWFYLYIFTPSHTAIWWCFTITAVMKVCFVFLFVIAVRISVPRMSIASLSKYGWVSILGSILLLLLVFLLGYLIA